MKPRGLKPSTLSHPMPDTIQTCPDAFTLGYLVCALWSSTGDDDTPLDRDHDVSDLAPEALAKAVADCAAFQAANADDLATYRAHVNPVDSSEDETAGHDLWLSRNGHGAGFFDRFTHRDPDGARYAGDRLQEAARKVGTCDLYRGDDGKLYLS